MLTEEIKKKVESGLNLIYTDILMLQDGRWVPDEDSINATLLNIECVADTLKIDIEEITQ